MTDTGAVKQPTQHLSASSIEEYERCGKAYQLRRIDPGVEGDPSYALVGGQAVHAATEALDWATLT